MFKRSILKIEHLKYFIVYLKYITIFASTKTIVMVEPEKKKALFDHAKQVFVKLKLDGTKKYWEVWTSKTKKNWELKKSKMSLDEAMMFQEEIINNNYKNLFELVTTKKK